MKICCSEKIIKGIQKPADYSLLRCQQMQLNENIFAVQIKNCL